MSSRSLPYTILALLATVACLLAVRRGPAPSEGAGRGLIAHTDPRAEVRDLAPGKAPPLAPAGKDPGAPPAAATVRPLTSVEKARFAKGEELYSICLGCHQPDGNGSPGMAPPLGGSRRVNGPPEKVIKILLQGLQGPYTHSGMTFDGVMPAPPLNDDEEVASVATYVRRAFGNAAEPVTPEQVGKVRGETAGQSSPWTGVELDGP